jgi:arylsulfatase
VLWATGTENSGISVFIQNDKLVVDYNAFDEHTVVESDVDVPAGDSTLTARFRRGDGQAGSLELEVNGADCGRGEAALFMRMISSVGSSIGYDHGSAVSPRYRAPYPFTGTLHDLVIEVAQVGARGSAEAEARAETSRQ